jgi:hypothetical protein
MSAALSNDLRSITALLAFPLTGLTLGQPGPCTGLLDAEVLLTLGTGATCSWLSDRKLSVCSLSHPFGL